MSPIFLLIQDVWPAIVDTIRFSHRYNRDVTLNKTTLAGLVTSADIDARLQQMADVFIDVRARARNLDHDWRKFRDAHIKVWKSIKGEDTTRELYYKLHQDFATIFRYIVYIREGTYIGALDGGGGGGGPMLPVDFKKWQCPLSLF